MEFTLYSIGDSAFLEQVLISLAMITDTSDFSGMIAVGLLISVIVIMVQAVLEGAKQINLQYVLIGWIMYATMFVPTASVKIEDTITGDVRVVDNVPIGAATAGALVSSIGFTITNLFEQGYGFVSASVTTDHFLEPLTLLNQARRHTYGDPLFMALDDKLGGGAVDTKRSLINYIKECTFAKVDKGETSAEKLESESIIDALKSDSKSLGTLLFLDAATPSGTLLTCEKAWESVNDNILENVNSNELNTHLARAATLSAKKESAGVIPTDAINDSLQALGITDTNAKKFIQIAVVEGAYLDAAIDKSRSLNDMAEAISIQQAIVQRNTQWAAEATMFMSTVRPIITFFEGLIFAITPLAAFMMVIGKSGIMIALKYFQVIMWMQLWLPLLSIANLFVQTAVHQDIQRFLTNDPSIKFDSILALKDLGEILGTWIGVGGMLAAATPVISLFIVTGSTYALAGLTDRMKGSDHFNEKIATPDAVSPASVMKSSPLFMHSDQAGTIATDAESLLKNLSFGSKLDSSVSTAQSEMTQAGRALGSSITSSIGSSATHQEAYSKASDIGRRLQAQGGSAYEAISGSAKSFMDKHGIHADHKDAVVGTIAAGVSAGAVGTGGVKGEASAGGWLGKALSFIPGVGSDNPPPQPNSTNKLMNTKPQSSSTPTDVAVGLGLNASAGVDGKAGSIGTTTVSGGQIYEDAVSTIKDVKLSDKENAQLISALSSSVTENTNEQWTTGTSEQDQKSLTDNVTVAQTTSDNYTEALDLQSTWGGQTDFQMNKLSNKVGHNNTSSRILSRALNDSNKSVQTEASTLFDIYKGLGMDQNKAFAASAMTALTNPNTQSNGSLIDNMEEVAKAIQFSTGRQLISSNGLENPEDHKPDRLQKTPQESFNNLEKEVVLGTEDARSLEQGSTKKEAKSAVSGKNGQPKTIHFSDLPTPPDTQSVEDQYDTQRGNTFDFASRESQSLSESEIRKAEDDILAFDPDVNLASLIFGTGDNIGNIGESIKVAALDLASNLGSGMLSMLEESKDTVMSYLNLTPETKGDISDTPSTMSINMGVGSNGGTLAIPGDMSLSEKVGYYFGAMSEAGKQGTEILSAFVKDNYDALMQTNQELNASGLTKEQAAVQSEAFGIGLMSIIGESFRTDGMDQAITDLKMKYAEQDEDGKPMIDKDGQPVLNQHNEDLTNKMVTMLQSSAFAGDRADSYILPISQYNLAKKNL